MIALINAMSGFQKVVVLAVFITILALGALALSSGPKEEKSALAQPMVTPLPKVSIPPIDAAAPTRTETATFALG